MPASTSSVSIYSPAMSALGSSPVAAAAGGCFKRGRRKSMPSRAPSPHMAAMGTPGIVFQIPFTFSVSSDHVDSAAARRQRSLKYLAGDTTSSGGRARSESSPVRPVSWAMQAALKMSPPMAPRDGSSGGPAIGTVVEATPLRRLLNALDLPGQSDSKEAAPVIGRQRSQSFPETEAEAQQRVRDLAVDEAKAISALGMISSSQVPPPHGLLGYGQAIKEEDESNAVSTLYDIKPAVSQPYSSQQSVLGKVPPPEFVGGRSPMRNATPSPRLLAPIPSMSSHSSSARSPSPRSLPLPHHRRGSSPGISSLPAHLVSPGLRSSADYDVDAMDDTDLDSRVLPSLSQLQAAANAGYGSARIPPVRIREIQPVDSPTGSSRATSPLLAMHDDFDDDMPPMSTSRWIPPPEKRGVSASSAASYNYVRSRRQSYYGDETPYSPTGHYHPYSRVGSPSHNTLGIPGAKRSNKTQRSPALPPSPVPSPMPKPATPRKRTISTHSGGGSDYGDGLDSPGPRKTCHSCKSTKSAQQTWRTGWSESVTLCNQCGLRYNRNGHIHCRNCFYIPTKSEANGRDPICKNCQKPM